MSLFLLLSFLTLSYSGAFYSINVMFQTSMLSVPHQNTPGTTPPAPSSVPDDMKTKEIVIFFKKTHSLFAHCPVTTSCAARSLEISAEIAEGSVGSRKPGHEQVHVQHMKHFRAFWLPLSKLESAVAGAFIPSALSALLFCTILQSAGSRPTVQIFL